MKEYTIANECYDELTNGKFIYFVSRGQNDISELVEDHHDDIKTSLEAKGYEFVSVPHILGILSSDEEHCLFPQKGMDFHIALTDAISIQEDGPAFIMADPDDDEKLRITKPGFFTDWEDILSWADSLPECVHRVAHKNIEPQEDAVQEADLEETPSSDIRFHTVQDKKDDDCGIHFRITVTDDEPMFHVSRNEEKRTPEPVEETQEPEEEDLVTVSLKKLREAGVPEEVISMITGCKQELSKMLITSSGKILLVDYDIEIKMPPLEKAMYFLYLKHPEGIRFKVLILHLDELLQIYSRITGRSDLSEIQNSIMDLTNPLSNSANEKCSRIKRAFTSKFNPEIAKNYYIDGPSGTAKSVSLPRNLITWEFSYR